MKKGSSKEMPMKPQKMMRDKMPNHDEEAKKLMREMNKGMPPMKGGKPKEM